MWTDIFGTIIKLDTTLIESRDDHVIYNECDPFMFPHRFFSQGQLVITYLGFNGAGDYVLFPFKWFQGSWISFRTNHNRFIRLQSMCNEYPIGLIKNLFLLFLGRWPFEDTWFILFFSVATHLVNHHIRKSGCHLLPLERAFERLEKHEEVVVWHRIFTQNNHELVKLSLRRHM